MLEQSAHEILTTIKEKIPEDLIVAEHTDDAHFYRYQPTGELYESTTRFTGMLDSPYLKDWAAKLAVQYIEEKLPSITMSNQDEIFEAAKVRHKEVLKDAGTTGTLGHEAVERWLLDWINRGIMSMPDDVTKFILPDNTDARVVAMARSAELFMQEWGARPIASELLVASPSLKYAGTLDGLKYIPIRIQQGDGSCKKDLKYGDFHHHNYSPYGKDREMVCFNCNKKVRYELAVTDWKTSNSIKKVEYAMQTSAYRFAFQELTGIKPKHQFIIQLDKYACKYDVMVVTGYKETLEAFKLLRKLRDIVFNQYGEQILYMQPTKEVKEIISVFN